MSDLSQGITKPRICEIRDMVFSNGKGARKPMTLAELKKHVAELENYLQLFADEYYTTEDPAVGRAYEDLYERCTDLRNFYVGARLTVGKFADLPIDEHRF